MDHTLSEQQSERIQFANQKTQELYSELSRKVVGQKHVVERLMIALIVEGHVLLEGLPGLAKTTLIKALGELTHLSVSRIQFTPDLLPADVIGTQIYDPKSAEFRVKKGPIFANLVLADEINRAPAKVQSALLEAMQERQVTIGDQTFKLPEPFMVMATQNPIEQEGTYPLPEAQVDRFLFKLKVGYSSFDEEIEIISKMAGGQDIHLRKVIDGKAVKAMSDLVNTIHVADKIRRYIVEIVFATRVPKDHGFADLVNLIEYGGSPRASINLERSARAKALLSGRNFVTPQDIKDIGKDVLRHRIIPTYEAEAENISTDDLIQRIFDRVDVP